MADLHAIIRQVFEIRRRAYRNTNPVLVKKDRDKLPEVVREAGFKVGAEIGVKQGRYTRRFFDANAELTMHAVDVWDAIRPDPYLERHRRYFRQTRRMLRGFNAVLHKARSLDAVKTFEDGSLDFVYIDAGHDFDNCVQDIIQWSAKVRRGGLVACHDYYHHEYAGVVPAVDAYVTAHRITPWYVTYELMPTAFWVRP